MILSYYPSELKLSTETCSVYLKSFKMYSVCEGIFNTPLLNSGSLSNGIMMGGCFIFITFLYYPDV